MTAFWCVLVEQQANAWMSRFPTEEQAKAWMDGVLRSAGRALRCHLLPPADAIAVTRGPSGAPPYRWVKWTSGPCPVPGGEKVDVVFAGGGMARCVRARNFSWDIGLTRPERISLFRLSPPAGAL